VTTLELRPRLATEIVDAAFQLYRRHFAELVSLSAFAFAPYVIVLLATGADPADPAASPAAVGFILILGWITGSLLEAAVVVAVSNSYLHGQPDAGGALRHTIARLGTVLMAVLVKWLLIALAFMVAVFLGAAASAIIVVGAGGANAAVGAIGLIVVGVLFVLSVPVMLYFFASFFAVPATVVLEGLGVRSALRRSRELARGFKWKVLGALGLPMLLFMVFQLVLAGIVGLLPVPRVIAFLLEQTGTVIAYPILAVIGTLLYYDARIRKEGFDIEMMSAELEPSGAIAAVPPSSPRA
jgi:hypothetical protein